MKYLLIYLLSALLLHASGENHQVKIIEKIISEISIDKKIVIWSDNKKILSILENNSMFETTQRCNSATVIVLESKDTLPRKCSSKHIFVLNYKLLSEIPRSFGALFWKKGRPNIVILEPRVESQNIKITKDLEPYLEERVW